jgi:hypothetical protein
MKASAIALVPADLIVANCRNPVPIGVYQDALELSESLEQLGLPSVSAS